MSADSPSNIEALARALAERALRHELLMCAAGGVPMKDDLIKSFVEKYVAVAWPAYAAMIADGTAAAIIGEDV